MKTTMAASERVRTALDRMVQRHSAGIKFDLETMRDLMRRLDDPHQALASIHVAGTNGKGSVCAMLEAILRARGLRPGLYTSPHLVRFNERIRVAGTLIDDHQLAPLIEQVEAADRATAARPGGRPATFFEFTTALAFLFFRQQGVRIAVIETGMGGRLDATNVLVPAVAVITRIGLDHAEWLGSDLPAVAMEKAGIIKPGRPLVIGAMPDAARAVIERVARERGAPLTDAAATVTVRARRGRDGIPRVALSGALIDYGTAALALPGGYQVENLATAIAALETFSRVTGIVFDPVSVRQALAAVRWPARMQRLREQPPVILDGAHNPDGAAALMRSVAAAWKGQPVALVTGMCADKDVRAMLRIFQRRIRRCWTVAFDSPRALAARELAAAARLAGTWEVTAADSIAAALDAATAWAVEHHGIVLIAGSLFLAADILRLTANPETVAMKEVDDVQTFG